MTTQRLPLVMLALVACGDESTETSNNGPTVPAAYFASGITYDVPRSRLVIFGGEGANRFQSPDTWEWDGNAWARTATTGPSGRSWASMVFDVARARIVLFSGSTASGIATDTWEYDGSWHQLNAGGPPGRYAHELSYDGDRQSVLLFGGRNDQVPFSDLWELKNGAWQSIATATSPTGRAAHGQAYDVARHRLVVFGGFGLPFAGTPTIFGDTWAWDGTDWQQKATTGPRTTRPRSPRLRCGTSARRSVWRPLDHQWRHRAHRHLGVGRQRMGTAGDDRSLGGWWAPAHL